MKVPTFAAPEYKTALAQCYVLANLIEHAPRTYADERPAAAWAEKIQHAVAELIKTFGRFDSVSQVVKAFADLHTRHEEAHAFLSTVQGENVWHAILDYAKTREHECQVLSDQLASARSALVEIRDAQKFLVEGLNIAHAKEVEALKADATSRGPRRWKTIEVPDA